MKRDQLVEYNYAVSPEQNDLFDAVIDKDPVKVNKSLESGTNPNQKDERGIWPLIMAINPEDYSKPVLETLVKVTDQDLRTSSGRSAIQYAIQRKNREAYHILREAGHSMDIPWFDKVEGGSREKGYVYQHVPVKWRKDGETYKESPQQWELKQVLEDLERATEIRDIENLMRRAHELVQALHVLGLSPDGFRNVAWLQLTREPSVIAVLLRHGASLDAAWYNYFNALGRVVFENDISHVEYLISLGSKEVISPLRTPRSPEMQKLLDENKVLD